jgi:aryl-alcohol dehydrogenase-like predicted oxidoreductase
MRSDQARGLAAAAVFSDNRAAAEKELPWCASHDTGVICYSPMQSGLLTDRFTADRVAALAEDDWRRHAPELAIAVVGAILVAGGDYRSHIRALGAIALFASMTNIVSGFLITDRMLKLFKTGERPAEVRRT